MPGSHVALEALQEGAELYHRENALHLRFTKHIPDCYFLALSYFPHFTDEASMAQRGQGSSTKSHSQSEAKWTDSQTSAIGARYFPTPLRLPPHSTVASFNAGIPALGTLWVLRFLAEF